MQVEQALFLKKEQHFLSNDLVFDFCGISKTLPFHSFGPAIRHNYIVHIVLDGKGTYHVRDQQYTLKKGDIFLIRPGESTFYRSDVEMPWVYAWISFSGDTAKKIIAHTPFKEENYTIISEDIQKYTDVILECFDYAADTLANELKLTELLYRFLRLLLADNGVIPSPNKKKLSQLSLETIEFIREHYTEDITVQEIADHLSVNRSHLSRVFHENLGMSVKEYLLGIRINRAAFLLSMTNETVEAIAYQAGFHSLIVFSRMFKKKTGETPTDYRKRAKKEEYENLSLQHILKQLEHQEIVSRAT